MTDADDSRSHENENGDDRDLGHSDEMVNSTPNDIDYDGLSNEVLNDSAHGSQVPQIDLEHSQPRRPATISSHNNITILGRHLILVHSPPSPPPQQRPRKHPSSPTPNAASTGDREIDLKPTPPLVSDLKSGRQQHRSTAAPDSTTELRPPNRSEVFAAHGSSTTGSSIVGSSGVPLLKKPCSFKGTALKQGNGSLNLDFMGD
nr:hypothetical protein Iba_chr03cCG3030 [Ipomoea batatas]